MAKVIFKTIRRVIVGLAITLLLILATLFFANWKISHDTQAYIYDNASLIPEQKVALVLGASKYIGNNFRNPYFFHRINAAKGLYDAGKVKAFVLSGDNSSHGYNEPEDMRNALIELGVPANIIYLDYAGLRTLDSVVRMNKIFGQDSFIVVSQKFHNERAIYLAQHFGFEVYGYNARDVNLNRTSFRTKLREKFARVKVFIDIILGIEPKFLGDPIEINTI